MITRLAATVAFALSIALALSAAAQEASEAPVSPPDAEQAPETATSDEPEPTEQEAPAQETASRERSGGFWNPPAPSPEAYDWIRLKSGEWLKGEIKRMRDEEMSFDSDELDELEIDWDDITALRSPRLHTYVFEGRRVHTGTAAMSEGRIVVVAEEGQLEFSREKIVRIVSGDQSERNWWSGKLNIGLNARSGNTDSTDLTSQFNMTREAAVTRFGVNYNGVISTLDSVETANNTRASLALDIYVSRRFFVTAPSFAWYQDKFINIEKQIAPGIGLGYDLIKRRRIDWEIGLGAAYQYTEFISVSEDSSTAQDAAAIFSTKLDLELTKNLDWDIDYQLYLVVTDLGLTAHHLLSNFSFEVWGPLDLDISLTWDRVEQPVPLDDGSIPESDDYRLSVGLGIEF
jgi:putative salt-induced outer membrane protein YdiY